MNKDKDVSVFAITYVLIIAIFIGFFALVSYLFQECWNLGVVKVFFLNDIDFQTSTYVVGFISLVGYIFRGWGISSLTSRSKEGNLENGK